MSENLKQLHERVDSFYAKNYLSTWCEQVRSEWTEFLSRVFSIVVPNLIPECKERVVVDIGCGPSISNVISASAWSRSIFLCDILESNRDEVTKFWKRSEDRFDWSHYFRFVGVLELNPDVEAIESRTRNAIKGVLYCDITNDKNMFLVEDVTADVIIASLVFDVVATTDSMFVSALDRVKRYLNPKGLIVIQGSLGENVYSVASSVFPVMNVDEVRLRNIFVKCQMEVLKWETTVKHTTHYFAVLQKI